MVLRVVGTGVAVDTPIISIRRPKVSIYKIHILKISNFQNGWCCFHRSPPQSFGPSYGLGTYAYVALKVNFKSLFFNAA